MDNNDPLILKVRSRLIDDKYVVVQKISEGGYGKVYLGKHHVTGEKVAIKLEHYDHTDENLELEFRWYKKLRSVIGIPWVRWYGSKDSFKAMVMQLLGPSLDDLLAYCGGSFGLKTTLMLADQLLQRLEDVHNTGHVHADVKPSNFLLGIGRRETLIHMIDLGIARPWDTRPEGPLEEEDGEVQIRPTTIGTNTYASISGHIQSRSLQRKDDMESLGYMLVRFMGKRLPWRHLDVEDNKGAFDLKTKTSPKRLCSGLPVEFADYMTHIKSLARNQKPDYQRLRDGFRSLAKMRRFEYDGVFD